MTDEEKAEEYIIAKYKLNECYVEDSSNECYDENTEETRVYMRNTVHSEYQQEYEGYLEGLAEGRKEVQKEKRKQCLCRVYYPQNYNSSAISNSRIELSDLLSRGWIVDSVIQNSGYFADYILSKELAE